MKKRVIPIVFFALVWALPNVWGQNKRTETIIPTEGKPPGAFMVDIEYGMHLPMADMAEYFKYNFSLGGKIQYLFPNNLILGLTGHYQFGDEVGKDVVSNLREPGGSIIDKFGTYSDVSLGQRGFFIGGTVGYLIPLLKKHKRSGLEFRVSGGYWQHWVNIEVIGSEVFALTDDYLRGYDRMTSGFGMSQYVGYRHLDKGGLLNFFGGFEFMQGFTQNRRGFNYDTGEADTAPKLDLLVGFKVGIAIPFYTYTADTEMDDMRYY
jgi:hypothetical protein